MALRWRVSMNYEKVSCFGYVRLSSASFLRNCQGDPLVMVLVVVLVIVFGYRNSLGSLRIPKSFS